MQAQYSEQTRPRLFWGLLGLFLLNGLLSFTAWWPTPAILPDARIAPEFVMTVILVFFAVRLQGRLPPALAFGLTAAYFLLILGRYLDVTAPSLFGRAVNLYWDIPQIPRFLWVSSHEAPLWLSGSIVIGSLLFTLLLAKLIFLCLNWIAHDLAPYTVKTFWGWAATGLAGLLVAANYAGVQATWPFVSKPVIPTYAHQFSLLWTALSHHALAEVLPRQTPIEKALNEKGLKIFHRLQQRDVYLIFLESFGAVLFDDPEAEQATRKQREELMGALEKTNRHVVSGFFTSPTIGGASDLAHMSVLSGVDLSDPRRHDLLLTTNRPTLIDLFKAQGYQTFGLYHAVSWPWPEQQFYGFDVYLDGPSLQYVGPALTYWSIPDQYAIAKLEAMYPRSQETPPRFLVFPTITSHLPFSPVPPYQPNWEAILSIDPFPQEEVLRALAEKPNWLNMRSDYLRTVNYVYQWLTGFFLLPEARETVFILIGDHQPTANITGEGVRWDVPVHIISPDPALLDTLERKGLQQGMYPSGQSLGGLHELAPLLLDAWSN